MCLCIFFFLQFWRQKTSIIRQNPLSQRMRMSFAKKRSSSSSFATTTKAETTKEMTNTNTNNDENNNNNNNNNNTSSSRKKSSSFNLPPSLNRETMFSFHCSATCSHGMLRCVFFTKKEYTITPPPPKLNVAFLDIILYYYYSNDTGKSKRSGRSKTRRYDTSFRPRVKTKRN